MSTPVTTTFSFTSLPAVYIITKDLALSRRKGLCELPAGFLGLG